MKLLDALNLFEALDKKHGRHVFSKDDLRVIFQNESESALSRSVERLVASGVIERPLKGVFVYTRSDNKNDYLLEKVARTFHQLEYCYVSLECALSEYGLISQIPINYLSVMTTGRSGVHNTPYGTIEFTHTQRDKAELIERTQMIEGRPLPIAKPEAALADLKRVGRNLNMIDQDTLIDMGLSENKVKPRRRARM